LNQEGYSRAQQYIKVNLGMILNIFFLPRRQGGQGGWRILGPTPTVRLDVLLLDTKLAEEFDIKDSSGSGISNPPLLIAGTHA